MLLPFKVILKNYSFWLISYGASFFIADKLRITSQGRAFMYIYLIGYLAYLTAISLLLYVLGKEDKVPCYYIVKYIITALVNILLTAIATVIFKESFFRMYTIMTFAFCFINNEEFEEE